MTHDDAFLRDIAERPADDAPRLIYADWLEEHGGAAEAARAAFIRAQCRLAQMPLQNPARPALEDECSTLLAQHGQEWAAPVRDIAERWEYCRGFIERIETGDGKFGSHAEALMKQLPLRAVALRLRDGNSQALADCLQLERLETLEIRDQHLRDNTLQPLLASPHLKRLTALNLSGNSIEGPAIQALLQANLVARLRRLDLSDNYTLGDRGTRMLVNSEQAAGLEVLRLGRTNLTPGGLQDVFASHSLRRLVVLDVSTPTYNPLRNTDPARVLGNVRHSPFLPRLISLDLSDWVREQSFAALLPVLRATRLSALYLRRLWLTNADAQRLADLAQLSSLTTLDLSSSRLGQGGATALAESPHLANLTSLDLGFNAIRDKGAKALASSPYLQHLRVLILRRNGIGGPGVTALVRSSNMDNLRWLDMAGNYINAATVQALARSRCMRQLTSLDLGDTRIGRDSAVALTQQSQLGRLERLFLDSNDLGNKGTTTLASAPTLGRLKLLNLRDTQMGKAGAEALAASPHLGRLVSLDVNENNLTDDEIRLLRQRFGKAVQDDDSDE
jgi:uncharacterized protein (TIGR02996 family)